ncbi:DNA helicase ATP-dependent RecQ type [Trinorchestia longiramus]|nr:DNA helicase ATP-dependent RecQ type [Trinorchestia longiramus]
MAANNSVVVITDGDDDAEYSDPKAAIRSIDIAVKKIDKEIQILQSRRSSLQRQKTKLEDALQQQTSAELAQQDWQDKEYPWTKELRDHLYTSFGINELRPHQLPTMNATLSGTNCILIMPTGGGKSLCYQLPALLSKGVTLVVSPLVSLIEDQVMGLRRRGLEAAMLTAAATKQEVSSILTGLTDAKWPCKLLYVTPEKLAKSKRLMAKLQKTHQMGRLARVAIDEVHCCSQWGHDFRPDYKFLGILRQTFPGVPLLGLTATATARVVKDVQKILNISDCLVLKASFNRPNLFYEVREKNAVAKESIEEVVKLLQGRYKGQSGIIYATTIKETLDLVTELRALGLKVGPYHGQMEAEVRSKVHRKWISNEYQAVVATIAFGMGIDKPDVRFVIHYSISKSMENFYQESGRAGRDGKPADCLLFWRFADLFKQSTMVFTEQTGLEKFYNVLAYCIDATRCRRNLLSEHFGERWDATQCNQQCDHCRTPRELREVDVSKHMQQISSIITHASSMDQRLTGQKLIDAWLGKGAANLRVKSSTNSSLSRSLAETIVVHLLLDMCLKEDFHFTPYSTISYIKLGPKAEAGMSPSPLLAAGPHKAGPRSHAQQNSDAPTMEVPQSSKNSPTDGKFSESICSELVSEEDAEDTFRTTDYVTTVVVEERVEVITKSCSKSSPQETSKLRSRSSSKSHSSSSSKSHSSSSSKSHSSSSSKSHSRSSSKPPYNLSKSCTSNADKIVNSSSRKQQHDAHDHETNRVSKKGKFEDDPTDVTDVLQDRSSHFDEDRLSNSCSRDQAGHGTTNGGLHNANSSSYHDRKSADASQQCKAETVVVID